MNTKRMVTNSILIAIGVLLRIITPALGVPMQADFSLITLFIILVFNKDYKTIITCGLIVGVFAALTSKTPGGQLPNVIDKFITCNIMYLILIPLRKKLSMVKQMIVLLPIGTVFSGTIFLLIIGLLVGLPGGQSFIVLFGAVVVPAVILNTIIGLIFYKVVKTSVENTGAYDYEEI